MHKKKQNRGGFNERHPELETGEVWFVNIMLLPHFSSEVNERSIVDAWSDLANRYKTVRLGKVAYDRHGKGLPELRPVFIQKSERDARPN